MAFGKSGRVNMDGSEDPFYRYTMPTIKIKVEGLTKMIKTQLINIDQVAQAVGRPPAYLVTFFGQELSANSKWDPKLEQGYVTGNQNEADLQRLVFEFIKRFVMCKSCNNPETQVSYEGSKKKKEIILTCISCGAKSTVDPTEKMCNYIIMHPMESGLGKGTAAAHGKKDKTEKEDKPSKKKGKKKEEESDDDVDWGEDVSPEAVKARKEAAGRKADEAPPAVGIVRDKNMGQLAAEADKEQEAARKKKSKEEKKKKKKKEESDDDDDDWSMDVSDEAVKARQAALCAGMENVVKKAEAMGVSTDEHLN